MKELPKTFDEARTRFKAYHEKLLAEGISEQRAYNMVIDTYERYGLKEKFAGQDGDIVGECFLCYSPVVVGEYYTVTTDKNGVVMWHNDCGVESPENALKISQL